MAACVTVPDHNGALDQARTRVIAAQNDPQVATLASDELKRATESLRVAEQAQTDHATTATIDHLAYITVQRVAIAQETASSRASQAITAGAAAERDKMRLAQRTNEANVAQQQLVLSEQSNARKSNELAAADQNAMRDQMRLAQSTNETDTAQRETNAAQQKLVVSEQSNAQKSTELAEANVAVVREQARSDRSDARVSDLETQLKDLNAKKTDHGMVVTLGDVLFDTGESTLLPGGSANIVKLAEFFKQNPQRTASIDGYTDNVGASTANYALSERRANAVMAALVHLGVPANRLSAQAHGEEMPTANNDTASGRQMNRRVEILIAPRSEDVSMQ